MKFPDIRISFPKALLFIFGFTVTMWIWFLNYITRTSEITFTLPYLIPISFLTWYLGVPSGIFLSIVCTATWYNVFATQYPKLSQAPMTYIDLVTKLIIFLGFVYLLGQLKNSLNREKYLARTDDLTGVLNERAFLETITNEILRSKRTGRPLTLAYLDLDNFKTVNDTFGHAMGDNVLRLVAQTLKKNVRATDFVARMGGDEFAVLFPEAGYLSSGIAISRIHKHLLENLKNDSWPTTVSMGVATCLSPAKTSDEIIRFADSLMYDAKKDGKNMIKHDIFRA